MIEEKIKSVVRDIPDFPKPGILFRDITPILADPQLCEEIVSEFVKRLEPIKPDALAGIEARGFIFGPQIAKRMGIPFVPIRKAGKLPYTTVSHSYDLEYGSATIEIHADAIQSGDRVCIHDDLLATGGTAAAAAELVKKISGEVACFSFVINLAFLEGDKKLAPHSDHRMSLATYA
jgi:adenine phosphoribosyltransferase